MSGGWDDGSVEKGEFTDLSIQLHGVVQGLDP